MNDRRVAGQAAAELAIGLPILILLMVTILQGAMIANALEEAQMLANKVAAESARSPGLLQTDPALFLDFAAYGVLDPEEYIRWGAAFEGERSFSVGTLAVRVEYSPLLTGAERREIAGSDRGPSEEESAAKILGGLNFGHVRVSVSTEIEPLFGVNVFHPGSFPIRAFAVGGLAEESGG